MTETAAPEMEPAAGGSFDLVKLLARELSAGNLEIPGFPDVAIRVREAINDEDTDVEKVANIISAEPLLTAQIIKVANSAAFRAASGEIKELRSAVARLGFSAVASTAMAFAVRQAHLAQKYEKSKERFDEIWRRSTRVGAVASVIARRCTHLNPDEALLAGLVHSIGMLYIYSRAEDHPDLFEDDAELGSILSSWYVPVGEAILQSWEFPADIIAAVAALANPDRERGSGPDLGDVLSVALPMPDALDDAEALETVLEATNAEGRLGLSLEKCIEIMGEAQEKIEAVTSAFAG